MTAFGCFLVLLAALVSLPLIVPAGGFQTFPVAERRLFVPSDGGHLLRRRSFRPAALPSVTTAATKTGVSVPRDTTLQHVPDVGDGESESEDDLLSHPSISGRWKDMYLRLRDFYLVNGHCRVPRRHVPDPSLGAWVACQRRYFRQRGRANGTGDDEMDPKEMMDEGRARESGAGNYGARTSLTDARIAALDALGFTWDPREHAWRSRIDDLARYRDEHGNCLVPLDHPDRGLAVFVRNQKLQYAYLEAGRPSTLDRARVEELRGVGFDFGTNQTVLWKRRYDELEQFVKERGHAMVPEKYKPNPALGSWVAHQRVRYRASSLDKGRIEALERIGFRWDTRSYSWSAMLDRLRTHSEQTGGFVVSRSDVENGDLRTWIRVQRYHRALRERGLPSPLSDRRLAALDDIGFVWTPRRGRKSDRSDGGGPTKDDWSKLFEELKGRGIEAGAEVKEHWFAGRRSFEDEEQELKGWDEIDMIALWEQGDDEDNW